MRWRVALRCASPRADTTGLRRQLVQADQLLTNDVVTLYTALGRCWQGTGAATGPVDRAAPPVPAALDALDANPPPQRAPVPGEQSLRPQVTVGLPGLHIVTDGAVRGDLADPSVGFIPRRCRAAVGVHPVDAAGKRLAAQFQPVADADTVKRRGNAWLIAAVAVREHIVDGDVVGLPVVARKVRRVCDR